MRILLLVVWLLLPLPVVAYHLGPGQDRSQCDEVARLLENGDRAAAEERWADAVAQYDQALDLLPEGYDAQGRRIRLERAKAQMFVSKLPQAHADLRTLVDELRADQQAGADSFDDELFAEARDALANSQYYITWLMRLEGRPREDWEPEIESSRQLYQHLAEESEAAGNPAAAERNREDLEASIRLARLSLADLQGLPLPSQ